MKFLEGKTPAERNKTIAAIVLGFLAVVAISYNLLPSASPRKAKTGNSNANLNIAATTSNGSNSNSSERQIPSIEQVVQETPFADLAPIPENPFPPVFGGETSRNIFAIYVPPPPPPPPPVPLPSPIPIPTPEFSVQFVSSNSSPIYMRQGDFTIDIGGDRFTPDAKIVFNGQELPTKFNNAQRLTAQVSANLIEIGGDKQIMVRTPDGSKTSNPMVFSVQTPPVPNYNFIGLVARKRYNNDTALLQDKQSKEYKNVRLGEVVGRFKVVSISSEEVVMQDTALNFRHNLTFVKEGGAAKTSSGSSGGRSNSEPTNNGFPAGFDPNNGQIQYQTPPQGIPGQYIQQQNPVIQPQMPPMPPPPQKDLNDDDDDDN